ncbi:GNAT family N-acetyltransferase [Bacillus sp. 2205SS5-2]|uniref:GNAT family N-acetyltransferase n=1 Tax=Bacillus sp. 2205SS5-2 TaxID=3109031 RepID=UPI003005EB54
MNIQYIQLSEPTTPVIAALNQWENDSLLIPLTRPNQNKEELERRGLMNHEDLSKRLAHHQIFLIYLDDKLIGEMNYMIDPAHLFKKEPRTAWIGITIGEKEGRGKGIGFLALQYLEEQIKAQGLQRIELGVFEFNQQAQKLYQKLGYQEIGRINDFTYWQGKMWSDIRMDKYLAHDDS